MSARFWETAGSSAKDRFHFNAFMHLNVLGTICYLVGGFGWPRTMDIDRSKLAHPRLYTMIIRLAGPLANLLLAGIGGSIAAVMKTLEWDPRVFLMVIGVNVTTAIYNLIPLPPLAMGSLVCELIPPAAIRTRALFLQIGPFLILALVLWERITQQGIFSPYIDPLIKSFFAYFQGPLIRLRGLSPDGRGNRGRLLGAEAAGKPPGPSIWGVP